MSEDDVCNFPSIHILDVCCVCKDSEGPKVFDRTMPSGNVGSNIKGNERASGVFNTSTANGKVNYTVYKTVCHNSLLYTAYISFRKNHFKRTNQDYTQVVKERRTLTHAYFGFITYSSTLHFSLLFYCLFGNFTGFALHLLVKLSCILHFIF